MVQDPTMSHEVLAYQAFERMGVFAPHAGFAYVWVNGKSYGLHLNLESPDKIALEKRFGPFQNPPQHLYEGELGADVSTEVNPRSGKPRIEDFEVDEGKSKTRTDLTNLLAAVEGSTGTYSERVAPYANLREMTREWMTERYIGHWDGYTGFLPGHFVPNNYYLYSDPAGVFQIFPWGTDQTWSEHIDFATPSVGVLFAKCLPDASCDELYEEAGEAALTALDALTFDTTARCTANAVRPWREYEAATSEAAKLPPYDLRESAEWQTWEREFIGQRPGELASFLGVPAPPPPGETRPCPPLRPIGGFKEPSPPGPSADQTTSSRSEASPGPTPPPWVGKRSVRANAVLVELGGLGPGHLSLLGSFKAGGKQATACRATGKQVAGGAVVLACRFTPRFKQRLGTAAAYLRLTATLTPATGAARSSTKTIRLPRR
jgi:hypothetical protein